MNTELNPNLLDVVKLAADRGGLSEVRTGTVVELLSAPAGSALIEVADEEGIPTDLLLSDLRQAEVAWQRTKSQTREATVLGAEDLFEQGLFLLQNGLITKARTAFAEAFRIDSRFAGTLLNLANESANRSAFEAAAFLYQMILELQPSYRLALENLAITHVNQGVAFARRGVIDKAIEEFNEALLLQPAESTLSLCKNNLVAAYTALGTQLDAIKRYQEGMQFFFLAFQLNPSEEIARRNLTLSLVAVAASELKGRGIPANESFKRFILMGLSLSECLNAFGATLAALGRTSEAKIILRRALDVDPANDLAKKNLEVLETSEISPELLLGIRGFEPRAASVAGSVPI
jgi:tetratricopeptide (TPR) repeat protein